MGIYIRACQVSRWVVSSEVLQEWVAAGFGLSRAMLQVDLKARILARLLLRDFLCSVIPLSCDQRMLDKLPSGQPVLSDGVQLLLKKAVGSSPSVSITHQGDWVAVCVSFAGDVGLDLSQVVTYPPHKCNKDIDGFLDDMSNVLSEKEKVFISSGSASSRHDKLGLGPKQTGICLLAHERLRRFYMLWSLKEAYLKAMGIGLVDNMDNYSFDVCDENGSAVLFYKCRRVDGLVLQLCPFEQEYVLALALKSDAKLDLRDILVVKDPNFLDGRVFLTS